MLQHLAKWALIAAIWRQSKPYLFGTLIAALLALMVSTLHGEYVEFLMVSQQVGTAGSGSSNLTTASGSSFLFLSYIAKWLLYLGILTGYLLFVRSKYRSLQKKKSPSKSAKNAPKPSVKATEKAAPDPHQAMADDQAFDFLRGKRKLKTRGEYLLEKSRDHADR